MEIHEININDYKVTQTIGQGQFGIVFLVVDVRKKTSICGQKRK